MFGIVKDKKVLAIPSDAFGCGQYRIIQPYRDLAINLNPMSKYEFKILSVKPNTGIEGSVIDRYDVFVLQRIITPQLLKFAKEIKRRNKILIQEIDDDLFNVDPMNPFNVAMKGSQYKAIFRESLKISDFIHTTTPEIKDSFVKNMKIPESKIFVFPNAIDTNHPLVQPSASRRKELPDDKIIFGWQGGSSHTNDIFLLQCAEDILEKYPNTAFAFCSHPILFTSTFNEKFSLKFKGRVFQIPPIQDKFDSFPNVPSMYDIGLAPLKINHFNNCKSWLKCIEYGIFGVPSIVSPIADYIRFEEQSDKACIVSYENTIKDWENKISMLIENEDMRKQLGEKTKDFILNNVTLRKVNKSRAEFFKSIFES